MFRRTRAITEQLEANTEAIRRLTDESVASLRRQTARLDRQSAILDQQVNVLVALTKSIEDHRDESRAHTKALLRMLDRLDGPEPGSATG